MRDTAIHSSPQHSLRKVKCDGRTHEKGAAYLMLMLAILIMGIGLVAVSSVWHTTVMRDKEQELLFYGAQFQQAIGQYYINSNRQGLRYPKELKDLLKDPRVPGIKRYLRKIYTDPMTGKQNWGLVRSKNGGIVGVYSKSDEQPIKIANFKTANKHFKDMRTYSDWEFIYRSGYK
ncbi:MAG: type II secretion system protein [Gallionella sp.]